MARRKKHGDRGDRGNQDNKSRKKPASNKPERPFADTPYGRVPLIERTLENAYGKTFRYFEYDLNFKPRIPEGAVSGDPTKQNFCPLCHTPRYYYTDQERTCVQCGDCFVFSGKEQKYWYEILQFCFDSVAIRCPPCRKKKRTEKALQAQWIAAQAKLKENPKDPAALLEDAESRVRYFQRTGEGNLDKGIASARKAVKIWPKAVEGLFWEGLAQILAGRSEKGRIVLETFVKKGGGVGRKRRPLYLEARKLIDEVS